MVLFLMEVMLVTQQPGERMGYRHEPNCEYFRWTLHTEPQLLCCPGPRRRRNAGGPGERYARTPVGIHPHLRVVGVGNLIAVPSMSR
jgi:hypothetical protein